MLKMMATILLFADKGISEEPSVYSALPLNQHEITAVMILYPKQSQHSLYKAAEHLFSPKIPIPE